MLTAEEMQAQQSNIRQLTQQAEGDTASLMARYGTRLATATASIGAPSVTSPFASFVDAARGLTGPMQAWAAPMAGITNIYANAGR